MESIIILLSLSLSLCVALALASLFLPIARRSANAIVAGFALCTFFVADVSFDYHTALFRSVPFLRRYCLFALRNSIGLIEWSFPLCELLLVNRA